MVSYAERYRDEGAFRVPLPGGRAPVFVGSASLVADLADETRFEKVIEGPLVEIRDFAGDGLFTAYSHEPNWHAAHRVLSPGFSSASMDRYFPAMVTCLEALLEHWRRSFGRVDVCADMTRLTIDTISLAGFNYRFDSFEQSELHPFVRALAAAFQETIDYLDRPEFIRPLFEHRRVRYRKNIEDMFSLIDTVIHERKRLPHDRWPKDFLSLMLENPDPKTGEKLSEENIRYQILTFLVAGHETTSGLLAFALHELARRRDLFLKLRAEVDAIVPTGMPTMKEVMSLDLVRRTLSEALRLWPTVPVVTRTPKEDTNVGRYFAPKGETFALLLSAIHTDPSAWIDPWVFDPDRFLPEIAKKRPSWAYKPFGVGARSCIGKHFALIETTLCLAILVREFDFEHPGPLRITPTISPKPKDFRLWIRPRRNR